MILLPFSLEYLVSFWQQLKILSIVRGHLEDLLVKGGSKTGVSWMLSDPLSLRQRPFLSSEPETIATASDGIRPQKEAVSAPEEFNGFPTLTPTVFLPTRTWAHGTIPGTGIDYPVMWTPEDESYYLYRAFDGGKE